MREIPLTQGFVALVSDEDYEAVSALKWHAVRHADRALVYAARGIWNAERKTVRRLMMHKFLTGWDMTDHADHNGLNNTRENLREVTTGQNAANQRLRRTSTTGFKGVTVNRGTGRPWVATATARGQRHFLGMFDTAEEAALAYDAAALDFWGEFACINFPERAA